MASDVTHIHVSGIRTIIGLILGLAIQFALVQPSLATKPASHCAASSCCEELSSCPCASNDDAEQRPSPLAPAPVDLKLSPPKARELDFITLLKVLERAGPIAPPASIPESHVGFTGVPLSLAFCTFVI